MTDTERDLMNSMRNAPPRAQALMYIEDMATQLATLAATHDLSCASMLLRYAAIEAAQAQLGL